MTEQEIERLAEIQMDRLDRLLMAGRLPQSTYDELVRALDRKTEASYAQSKSEG